MSKYYKFNLNKTQYVFDFKRATKSSSNLIEKRYGLRNKTDDKRLRYGVCSKLKLSF